MDEMELLIEEAREHMDKTFQHVGHELTKIRAGKASPAMLDGVQVPYYGTISPLHQVSSITTPDARSIFVKPWEKSMIQDIEKAILAANLGLTPTNDGQQVILNVPTLTEERRKQLVKQVGQECEHGRVSVRAVRKDINDKVKKLKGISEDAIKDAEERVQKLTDDVIGRIDALMTRKEQEIMTV